MDLHDAVLTKIEIARSQVRMQLTSVSVSPYDDDDQKFCSIEIRCEACTGISIHPTLWGESDYVYDARARLADGRVVDEFECALFAVPIAATSLLLRLSSGAELVVHCATIRLTILQ